MKPTNDLEKAIGSFRLKTSDSLDQRIAASILADSAQPAGQVPSRPFFIRLGTAVTCKHWARYATAAMIVVGVALALTVINKSASLTLADVKAAVAEQVHSVRYRQSTTYSGLPGRPPFSLDNEILIAAPSRMRQTSPMGIVIISDDQARKALLLITPQKEAIILEHRTDPQLKGIQIPRQERNLLDELKALDEASARSLGQKTIADRAAIGFEVAGGKETVWVDPHSRLPLQIHRVALAPGDPPKTEIVTMSDFEWNIAVDESLLSLTPPDGYEVHRFSEPGLPTEGRLLQVLRTFAERNGGRFPEELNLKSFREAMRQALQQKDGQSPGLAGTQREIIDAMEGMAFLESPAASDWHYAGAGVVLDQPNTPILWYRPKGSARFRVIYADLSVQEVPADALPTVASKPLQRSLASDPLDYDATATPTEADLLVSLRLFAELNDNHLPDELSIEATPRALEQIKKRQGHMTLSEKVALTRKRGRISHGISFITMGGGGDWHYAGFGVRLGTPNCPMLWYRPRGAVIYRVIDADMSVREVRPEDLPKVPSTLLWTAHTDSPEPGGPAGSPLIEHDVVEALRYMAELSRDRFPDQINMTTYDELQGQADDASEAVQRLHQLKTSAIFNGLRFMTDSQQGEDWHYAGQGVTLGQAGKPILWYRPKNSAVYRAIHADLTVQSVAPEALPTTPSATLTQRSIFGSQTERDLLNALRIWAELNGSTFPADLSPKAAQQFAYADSGKDLRSMPPEDLKLLMARQQKTARMSRGIIFLATIGKYQYLGVEVPLGQAGTPVLWYRPRKSSTYRVIYADLTVRDAAKEDLPAAQTQPSGAAPAGMTSP